MTVDLPPVSSSKDFTVELSTEVVRFSMLLFFLSICSGCVCFLTDGLMTLQLQVEQESFGCYLDFPPGFEEKNMTVNLPLVSSPFNDERVLSRSSHATDPEANDCIQPIVERVLHELHLSAKMSLGKYFTSLLHEEAMGKVDLLKDGMINKVNI